MRKLAVIICLVAFAANSQDIKEVDANVWTGVQLNLPITKKLDVGFESQTRFYQNATQLKQVYGELSVGYGLGYGFSVTGIYRYSRSNRGSYYGNVNRFALDAAYRYKTEIGLSFKARLRYQHSFDRIKVVNDVYPNKKNVIRTALKISYKNKEFKRVQPYIGGELFYAFAPKNETTFWDTYRFKSGVKFDLPKNHEISVFYIFEHENRTVDNVGHIYGLQYAYTFRRLNKGKKKKKSEDKPSED